MTDSQRNFDVIGKFMGFIVVKSWPVRGLRRGQSSHDLKADRDVVLRYQK